MASRKTSSRAAFLETLVPLTENYDPAPGVRQRTAPLEVTAVMGPSGVGKNAAMDVSELPIVTAVTSRPQRPGEAPGNPYRWFYDLEDPHDAAELYAKLDFRLFVQAASHPASKEIYASEPADYPREPSLMDVTAQEFHRLRKQQLFARLTGICLVNPSPQRWITQWLGRDSAKPAHFRERLDEAGQSLITCIRDESILLVVNDDLEETGAAIRAISEGQTPTPASQAEARQLGKEMLASIAEIYPT